MATLTIIFGIFALAIGSITLSANPQRQLNQIFFIGSLIQFFWIACVYAAIKAGARGNTTEIGFLLRSNAVIAAFFPLGIWLTKELIITPQLTREKIIRSIPWLLSSIVLFAVTFLDSFLIQNPIDEKLKRGTAYYGYQTISSLLYILLTVNIFTKIQHTRGIKRIELQFFSLNIVIGSLLSTILTTTGNALDSTIIKRSSIVIFYLSYASTIWAITNYKIFNLNQSIKIFFRKSAITLTASFIIVIFSSKIQLISKEPIAPLLTGSLLILLAFWIDNKSRDQLDLDEIKQTIVIRQSIIEISQKDINRQDLIEHVLKILKQEFKTDNIKLFFSIQELFPSSNQIIDQSRHGYTALCDIGWATPESLERRNSNASVKDLHEFLVQNKISAVTISPREGRQPSLLITLGQKEHFWPYTHPEIQRLQKIADLIDYILSGSRFKNQSALQAKIEQLELFSQGFAHDLRNLITPVSTFLLHTESRLKKGTEEADVHAAAKKSMQTMSDYLQESLLFSRQTAPYFAKIDVSNLLTAVRELTITQASQRKIRLTINNSYNGEIIGNYILLQRLFVNLVFNAIDASIKGGEVQISSIQIEQNFVQFQVVDQGSGISPEKIEKIFEPYFTTKRKEDTVQRFGLGLAICRKIAELHKTVINVDSKLGSGSIFTIRFIIHI